VSKRNVFFAGVLIVCLVVILTMAAGCTRPKPEAKQTPTATVLLTPLGAQTPAVATVAPGTTPAAEPTIVTTKPGSPTTTASAQPTLAGGAMVAATPTPVVLATVPSQSSAASTATAVAPAGGPTGGETQYTVKAGDTLYSLARRFGTTVEAIVSLNKLASADQISAGMTLRIPAGGGTGAETGGTSEYVVQAGDNMGSIAVRFDTTVAAILAANGLSNPDFVYPGQKLIIPAGSAGPSEGAGPTTHVVQAGETLSSIAAKYGVTTQAIMNANNISNPNLIYPGQRLQIP